MSELIGVAPELTYAAVLEKRINELDNHIKDVENRYYDYEVKYSAKLLALEAECRSLRAIAAGRDKGHPMDRGMTFIAKGDSIPSSSPADLLAGNVYLFKDDQGFQLACQFVKNDTFAPLVAGQAYKGGIVDKLLRHPCVPNNFCYLEI